MDALCAARSAGKSRAANRRAANRRAAREEAFFGSSRSLRAASAAADSSAAVAPETSEDEDPPPLGAIQKSRAPGNAADASSATEPNRDPSAPIPAPPREPSGTPLAPPPPLAPRPPPSEEGPSDGPSDARARGCLAPDVAHRAASPPRRWRRYAWTTEAWRNRSAPSRSSSSEYSPASPRSSSSEYSHASPSSSPLHSTKHRPFGRSSRTWPSPPKWPSRTRSSTRRPRWSAPEGPAPSAPAAARAPEAPEAPPPRTPGAAFPFPFSFRSSSSSSSASNACLSARSIACGNIDAEDADAADPPPHARTSVAGSDKTSRRKPSRAHRRAAFGRRGEKSHAASRDATSTTPALALEPFEPDVRTAFERLRGGPVPDGGDPGPASVASGSRASASAAFGSAAPSLLPPPRAPATASANPASSRTSTAPSLAAHEAKSDARHRSASSLRAIAASSRARRHSAFASAGGGAAMTHSHTPRTSASPSAAAAACPPSWHANTYRSRASNPSKRAMSRRTPSPLELGNARRWPKCPEEEAPERRTCPSSIRSFTASSAASLRPGSRRNAPPPPPPEPEPDAPSPPSSLGGRTTDTSAARGDSVSMGPCPSSAWSSVTSSYVQSARHSSSTTVASPPPTLFRDAAAFSSPPVVPEPAPPASEPASPFAPPPGCSCSCPGGGAARRPLPRPPRLRGGGPGLFPGPDAFASDPPSFARGFFSPPPSPSSRDRSYPFAFVHAARRFVRHSTMRRSLVRPKTSPLSSNARRYVHSSRSLASSAPAGAASSSNTATKSSAGSAARAASARCSGRWP